MQPRSQGLSSYRGGKMRDPGNEVAENEVKQAAKIVTQEESKAFMFLRQTDRYLPSRYQSIVLILRFDWLVLC